MRIAHALIVALAITITGCGNSKKQHIEDDSDPEASTQTSDTPIARVKPAYLEFYATYIASEICPDFIKMSGDSAITALTRNGQSFTDICTINSEYYSSPEILSCHESDTATVNRILASPQARAYLPADFRPMWSLHPTYGDPDQHHFSLIALKTVNGAPVLDYRALELAYAECDPTMGNIINIRMRPVAAKAWRQITGDNVGRPIAMVIDGRVYSAPTVNCAIEGGRSQITGTFNEAEAQLLADRLQASVFSKANTDDCARQLDKRTSRP